MKPFSSLSSGEIMRRSRFISDSLLAFGSTFFLTGLIFQLHLPSRLPDSLLVYLPVILALAYLRGLYPALLTSIVAFVSFDFLFVPPLYSFAITKFEDILTLIVFLLTSIVTAELAAAIRIHEERTQQRMRETQLLYDIVCAANREEDRE